MSWKVTRLTQLHSVGLVEVINDSPLYSRTLNISKMPKKEKKEKSEV